MLDFLPLRRKDRNAGRLTDLILLAALYVPGGVHAYDAPLVVRTAAALAQDDNVANAALTRDRRDDRFLELEAAVNHLLQPSLFWSLELEAALGVREYNRYTDLAFVAPEVTGRASYRPVGGFFMPTLSGHIAAAYHEYRSRLRDGVRYRAGLQLRQPITTRIHARLLAEQVQRHAGNDVFDYRFRTISVSANWRLNERNAIYIRIARRKGDLVSTSGDNQSLKNAAETWRSDDAFTETADTQISYRIDARADQYTVGLHHALSDSLDAGLIVQHQDAAAGYGTAYRRNVVMARLARRF